MTRIQIFRSGGKITGFETNGHSGYAEEGSDIVCSAVSALTQTAVMGLLDVAELPVKYSIEDGRLSCTIPKGVGDAGRMKADMILETMLLGLRSMKENYGEYLKITEREV